MRAKRKNPSGKFSVYELNANGYGGVRLDRDQSWESATSKAVRIEQSKFPKNPGRVVIADPDGEVFWAHGQKISGTNAGDLGLFYVPTNPLSAVMWITAGALGTVAVGTLLKRT